MALTGVSRIPRVGLAKISLRSFRTLNSERSPYSAQLRRDPVSGSASRTCWAVISASERCPASAQPAMMGAIPMMWMRAV